MLTGYQFRLRPTPSFARLGLRTAGACRWLWNWALDYRQALWLAAKSAGATGLLGSANSVHLSSLLKDLKAEYPFLRDVPHHCLQQTLRDLDIAFTAFFEGRARFPVFRRKGRRESFRFPDPKQFQIDGDWVKLPKFGWVRFHKSREIVGIIKHITVAHDGDIWLISFCCEGDYRLSNYDGEGVGVDVGIAQDITLSNGDVLLLGAPSETEQDKLTRLQQAVARKTKGSNRWRRAKSRVVKLHRHLVNRRRDRQHKISYELATQHSFVALENLNLRGMIQSNVGAKSDLNRELLVRGFGELKTKIAYKCARAKIPFVLVDPAFTSQTCPQCHHCAPENRKNQAAFRCVVCGHVGNADVIAATNIKAAGQAAIARQYAQDTSQPIRLRHPRPKTRTHLRAGQCWLVRNLGQSCSSRLGREDVKEKVLTQDKVSAQ